MRLSFSMPWPPSVNTYWRSVPGVAHPLISKAGRDYRKSVLDGVFLVQGVKYVYAASDRLALHIVACPPDKRRRDLDNTLKAALDSLTVGGLWADDSQIDRILIERGEPEPDGVLYVVTDLFSRPSVAVTTTGQMPRARG